MPDGKTILFHKTYAARSRKSVKDITGHPNYSKLTLTLTRMKELIDETGASFKIVLFPSKSEVYSWLYYEKEPWSTQPVKSSFSKVLAEICSELGVDFLDIAPALISESKKLYESSGELFYWSDDTHFNAKGHQRAATLLKKFLSTSIVAKNGDK